MAQREAAIRITIKAAGFAAELRAMEDKVEKTGKKMGRKLSAPMKAGLSSVKKTLADMGGTLKDNIKNAAAFGGALVGGAMVTKAIEAERAYATLSANIRDANGELISAKAAQAIVEGSAKRTRASMESLRESALQLSTVGGPKEVGEFLDKAALQARRLGVETSIVARTYSRLKAKGLAETAEQTERLTQTMYQFGRTVLGVDPDEAIDPNDMAEFAAFANTTGAEVKELTGLLSMTGSTVKDMGQAFEVIEEIGLVLNTRKGLKELGKAAGMSKDAMAELAGTDNSIERLLRVMNLGPKAAKALQDSLGTDRAKQAFDELIGKELSIKLKTGKVTKDEMRVAAQRIREGIESASDETKMVAEMAKKDKELMKSKHATITDALNKLEQAFTKPKMLDAIERITKMLPDLAEGFANIMQFILDNPMTAAAGYATARVGLSFAGGYLQKAGADLGSAAMKKLAPLLMSSGVTAGTAMGTAAKVGLIAAAGAIGFMIGKEIASAFWDAREKREKEAAETTRKGENVLAKAQAGAATQQEKELALEEVKSKIADMKSANEGVLGTLGQFYHDFSAMGAAVVTGGEVKYKDQSADELAKLESVQRELTASIEKNKNKQGEAAAKLGQLNNTVGDVNEGLKNLSDSLKAVPSPPGNRGATGGPPGPLPTGAGHGGPQ